jgi:hypothetical protein
MSPDKSNERRQDVDGIIADVDRILSNWKGEPDLAASIPPPVVVAAKAAPLPPPPPPPALELGTLAEPLKTDAPPAKPATEPKGWATSAPEGFPAKRVRRVGILYCPEAAADIAKFVLALQSQKSSQNPIFVLPIFVKPYSEVELSAWVEKARAGGAVALLVVAPSPDKRKGVGHALAESKPPARIIAVEELSRRALIVDLVVDLMLHEAA